MFTGPKYGCHIVFWLANVLCCLLLVGVVSSASCVRLHGCAAADRQLLEQISRIANRARSTKEGVIANPEFQRVIDHRELVAQLRRVLSSEERTDLRVEYIEMLCWIGTTEAQDLLVSTTVDAINSGAWDGSSISAALNGIRGGDSARQRLSMIDRSVFERSSAGGTLSNMWVACMKDLADSEWRHAESMRDLYADIAVEEDGTRRAWKVEVARWLTGKAPIARDVIDHDDESVRAQMQVPGLVLLFVERWYGTVNVVVTSLVGKPPQLVFRLTDDEWKRAMAELGDVRGRSPQ